MANVEGTRNRQAPWARATGLGLFSATSKGLEASLLPSVAFCKDSFSAGPETEVTRGERQVLEAPRGAALPCFLEDKRRWVWGRLRRVCLSVNRPFLPLPQMSESETLISMVNRMVENSSPRAQLFMQVRPLPGSMVPTNAIPAACAWSRRPICEEAHSAHPAHLPGLITPGDRLSLVSSLDSSVSPPCFTFMGKPKAHFPNHRDSQRRHLMPCWGSRICFGTCRILFHVFCLVGTRRGGQGHEGCNMEPSMPMVCRMCCGHQTRHQGWAALA